ncbi:MAG: DUF222 domain-containing protein [Actinomycetota bacterium]
MFDSADVRSLRPSPMDAFDEVHREWVALSAKRLRLLAEVDGARAWAAVGATSCEAWLSDRHRLPAWEARRDVEAARALQEMPAAREALASGELPSSALRTLVEARKIAPEAFSGAEGTLVEAATELSQKAFRNRVELWRHRVEDPAGAAKRRHEARRVHYGRTLDGMVRLDGMLDTEAGQVLITAVRAVVDSEGSRGEVRTHAQRRADALEHLCRSYLGSRDRPRVGGERPVVTVTVDASVLSRGSGPGGLPDAGPVPAEIVRRMACDASVVRMVMSGDSEPLDVGRKTRVVPAGLRRAVEVRDRHCRFPGCDRPPAWSDVHHVVHWADGGPTSLANLLLLCWAHHRAVHQEGFGLSLADGGRPVFTTPDGRVLGEDRAPRHVMGANRGPP